MNVKWLIILCLPVLLGTDSGFFSGPNLKKAYEHHYQGSLLYAEGQYRQANAQFQQAYKIIPTNFYFGLSYGLSLGKIGKIKPGLETIRQANQHLSPFDPEYLEKRAISGFLEGMLYVYDGQFDIAYPKVAGALTYLPDTPRVQSVLENVLGYITIMNQGNNIHKGNKVLSHYHVHKRDLERSKGFFEQALKHNPNNAAAFHNYQIICDTLGIANNFRAADTLKAQSRQEEQTFLNMPQRILQALELNKYKEIVFLVDVSGSMVKEKVTCMADTRFAVMKDLSMRMLVDISEQAALGIGTIGGDCPDEPAIWKPAGSIPKDELRTELRFLIPDGTTPLLTMLRRVPELFTNDPETSKTIFLISDGANTCRSEIAICEWAEKLAQQNIAVNVLTFLNSTFNNTDAFAEYICLADNTNGKVIYVDNYRCSFEPFTFDLVETCLPKIPKLEKSYCWGNQIETLWMYYR